LLSFFLLLGAMRDTHTHRKEEIERERERERERESKIGGELKSEAVVFFPFVLFSFN